MAKKAKSAIAADRGLVRFHLTDVGGGPLDDPGILFSFRRLSDTRAISDPVRRPLQGSEIGFDLPAFPLQELVCQMEPMRYRIVQSDIFRVQAGKILDLRPIRLPREPEQWQAAFTSWGSLPAAFGPFKQLLSNSGPVGLWETADELGSIAGGAYDAMPQAWRLAKTSLLNLRHKLEMKEPISKKKTWLSFFTKILEIGRERMLALAHLDLAAVVAQIHKDISEYPDYERAVAENHRSNVPEQYRDRIQRILSIKSSESLGNMQLVVSTIQGEDFAVVDADIDENGDLLPHLFDALVRHRITGGTHPYDIHEILLMQDPQARLGYELV